MAMSKYQPHSVREAARRRPWLGFVVLVITIVVTALAGCATTEAPIGAAPGSSATAPTTPPMPGTPAAAAWEALVGPEGEYAAAAAYEAVIERYGNVEPYVSIHRAELMHVDALVRQLDRMGVSPPPNPWTGRIPAPDSLQIAARAWADGEVANIALYDRLLAQTDGDAALTRVFTNLRRASGQSHLPLFRQAAENGGTIPAGQMPSLGGTRAGAN
jgi:hypothetical protein